MDKDSLRFYDKLLFKVSIFITLIILLFRYFGVFNHYYVFGLISASYIFLRSFIGGILGINMAIQWEWIIKWFYIIFLGAKPEIEENEVTQGQNRGLVDRSFEIRFSLYCNL